MYSRSPDKPMIKSDIANHITQETGLRRNQSVIAVDSILGTLRDALLRGERIELRGFGVFQIRPRKTGIGRNPKTGEEVVITPGKTVRFKPSKLILNT